jgi:hypothetical protein
VSSTLNHSTERFPRTDASPSSARTTTASCPEVLGPFFDILMGRNEQHPSAYYGNNQINGTRVSMIKNFVVVPDIVVYY